MTISAIRVEHLCKQYRIGERNGYNSLRESISQLIRSPFHRFQGIGDGTRNDDAPHSAARLRPVSSGNTLWALKDVSFEVEPGDVVGIIGRNGGGKSTLLKILSKITEPTRGRIELRGRVGSLLEVGTGFHPELTGKENIFLYGSILGMTRREIERKLDEIVDFAGVEKFIDTPVKRFSSGMYMRLAFAVAAHLHADILLVDEILAVGDAAFQKKCLGKMGRISREGRTILFVSHDLSAVWIDAGSVCVDATPAAIIPRYLSQDASPGGSTVFDEDRCKEIQIRAIRITDSLGGLQSTIEKTEDFTVEITYDVRKRHAGVHVSCNIKDSYGRWILASTDGDVDPERIRGKREVGRFVARLTIPGGVLNSGQYFLSAGIAIHNQLLFDWQEGPGLTLANTQQMTPISSNASIHAVLDFKLPWRVERMASPAASLP